MKTSEEIFEAVLEKRDRLLAQRRVRIRRAVGMLSAGSVLAVCAVVLTLVFAPRGVTIEGKPTGTDALDAVISATAPQTAVPTVLPTEMPTENEAGKTSFPLGTPTLPPIMSTSRPGTPDASDAPGAVLTRVPVTFGEASARFGYPIVPCTDEDFEGYELGLVTQNGDAQGENAKVFQLRYLFREGVVGIQDWNVMGPGVSAGYETFPSEEYGGRTFRLDEEQKIVFLELSERVVMIAQFKDAGKTEVFERMMRLAGE